MNMNNITLEEQKAIKSWTSDSKEYRYIKQILKGERINFFHDFYEKRANDLINMFLKYKDNTNNKVLFRGDVIESNEEFNFIISKKVGEIFVLEGTLLSFTLNKKIAIESYQKSDKIKGINTSTILIIIENRKSVFLDISKYSHFPNEKEVICNKNLEFIIKNIEVKKDNHIEIILDEV
ncbi:hypothetical protein N5U18_02390 [Aliarcobacter butzleri]|uniref:hypothetical protein n=1 Tax=Aliarcobacter butzleri TaxID=28197 RepID=UPI0021B18545|nr:hypothetical protein [Aliarcobacter butzleri]MCT7547325.1 hypothetical protein [Aliarcobacter butzleri]